MVVTGNATHLFGQGRSKDHGSNHLGGYGLEHVRAAPYAVSDHVAHEIRHHCRISRVILRDPCLHLRRNRERKNVEQIKYESESSKMLKSLSLAPRSHHSSHAVRGKTSGRSCPNRACGR